MQPSLQHFPQDNNLVLLAQTNVSVDTSTGILGFDVPGGFASGMLVVQIGTPTGTSPSLNVELHESSDAFASNDVTCPLRLHAITTAGTYFIPVNNQIVTKKDARLFLDLSGTTPVFPTKVWFEPDED